VDPASHHDLLVVITVFSALEITIALLGGVAIARKLTRLQRDVLECQRLARGVAGLVAQQTGTLRDALRQRS
jgi:hypothetical protein